MRERVEGPRIVRAAHGRLSHHKTLPSEAAFEKYWRPKPDEVAHVPRFEVVWHLQPFLSPLHLSPLHLDFHINPLKTQEQPFNLLVF
jgi:hypothetical protein